MEKKSTAKTIYKPVEQYERRPFDDVDDNNSVPLWPQGSQYMKVVTWPTFLSYWTRKFPHIKVRKKGADTCTDCQILSQEFRMRQTRQQQMIDQQMEDDEEGDTSGKSDEEENDNDNEPKENDIEKDIYKPVECSPLFEPWGYPIINAIFFITY